MSTTTPSVYVGTYHKYNCGSIYGQWFDLTDFDDEEDFYAACGKLHGDEADPELMFQDWEGIPTGLVSEGHVTWDFIDSLKQAEAEGQGGAFVAWVECSGACDYDAFQEAYCGEAESEEDYARDSAEDSGLLNEVPESLRCYFDFEAYARDLFCGELTFHNGYVFSA
ncbi:antirestriction protein ArdA [Acerihabitans sp. TG2]|uniref:antirestriction protein ArdA n=1 Tax=Acerihabitans sp. TG2 TaxID=3096008 RepID=UPI003A599369